MVRRFVKKIKKHFKEVIALKTSPHSIAIGFAVGTFISVLPTPGLNIILALFIAATFKKISKLSLLGSLVIWNPFVKIFTDVIALKIGSALFGNTPMMRFNFVQGRV